MRSVKIEKPCHEDWSAMTPSQKGAFCDKCQIDVFDFSKRSNEEIKSILLENKGQHMCGRFTKSQLAELNQDYHIWDNQSTRVFQSKFLLACMLVFGMSLFTSCIEDEEVLGEIAVEHLDEQDNSKPKVTDSYDYTSHKKGKIKYVPEETESTNCNTEELHIKGEVVANDFISGDTIVNEIQKITNETEPPTNTDTTEYWEYFEMGDIAIDPGYYEHLSDTVQEVPIDSLGIEELPPEQTQPTPEVGSGIILNRNLSVEIYPNPAADVASIVLNVPSTDLFEVDLHNLSGEHLERIYSGIIAKGLKRFEIDLSPYESGTFIVTVRSNGRSETVKVQKVL